MLKNRSRYEQPFDTSDAVSSRTRGSDGFQDDFEREINGGRSAAGGGGRGGSAGRFDAFEDEGPEEAWSSAPQRSNGYSAGGNGAVPPLHPQRTGRAEDGDGDCTWSLLLVSRLRIVLTFAATQCSTTPSEPRSLGNAFLRPWAAAC